MPMQLPECWNPAQEFEQDEELHDIILPSQIIGIQLKIEEICKI
jgi:hypothetical protein